MCGRGTSVISEWWTKGETLNLTPLNELVRPSLVR